MSRSCDRGGSVAQHPPTGGPAPRSRRCGRAPRSRRSASGRSTRRATTGPRGPGAAPPARAGTSRQSASPEPSSRSYSLPSTSILIAATGRSHASSTSRRPTRRTSCPPLPPSPSTSRLPLGSRASSCQTAVPASRPAAASCSAMRGASSGLRLQVAPQHRGVLGPRLVCRRARLIGRAGGEQAEDTDVRAQVDHRARPGSPQDDGRERPVGAVGEGLGDDVHVRRRWAARPPGCRCAHAPPGSRRRPALGAPSSPRPRASWSRPGHTGRPARPLRPGGARSPRRSAWRRDVSGARRAAGFPRGRRPGASACQPGPRWRSLNGFTTELTAWICPPATPRAGLVRGGCRSGARPFVASAEGQPDSREEHRWESWLWGRS